MLLVENQLSTNCTSCASTQKFFEQFFKKATVTSLLIDNKYVFASLHILKKSNTTIDYIHVRKNHRGHIENGHVESKTLA
jgi:hypothetical protein